MITRARQREPEIVELMQVAGDAELRQAALRDALGPFWPQIQDAARERRKRSRCVLQPRVLQLVSAVFAAYRDR
jgi:hypothetical protein